MILEFLLDFLGTLIWAFREGGIKIEKE